MGQSGRMWGSRKSLVPNSTEPYSFCKEFGFYLRVRRKGAIGGFEAEGQHDQIYILVILSACCAENRLKWVVCEMPCCVLVAQPCPTLCDPMDCSQPGSSAHEILQARVLEWVAISFSRGSSQPRDWTWILCHLSHQGSPWEIAIAIIQIRTIVIFPSCPFSVKTHPLPQVNYWFDFFLSLLISFAGSRASYKRKTMG